MRILHRYLLKELVANAVVSMVVIFTIFFLGGLSIQVGKSQFENLPMVAILKYVAWILLYTGYLTLPLCIVTTCIFTYGRAAQDGEIVAAQTSGIRINNIMLPGIFLGACAMLLLAILQNHVMPDAHFQSRQVDEAVFENVEQLLKRRDRSIRERDFVFQWASVGEDATGSLVLEDVELVQFHDKKEVSSTRAKRARPVVEEGGSRVTLELEDVHRAQQGSAVWLGRTEVPIDLAALRAPTPRTNENQLTYEELLSGAQSSGSDKRRNRLSAEFHFRLAMALSGLLLAAFAAPFGIALRVRNRAVVFLAAVLVMLGLYLPLVAVAKSIAEKGTAPAWFILQVPNLILGVTAAVFIRKVNHP